MTRNQHLMKYKDLVARLRTHCIAPSIKEAADAIERLLDDVLRLTELDVLQNAAVKDARIERVALRAKVEWVVVSTICSGVRYPLKRHDV